MSATNLPGALLDLASALLERPEWLTPEAHATLARATGPALEQLRAALYPPEGATTAAARLGVSSATLFRYRLALKDLG